MASQAQWNAGVFLSGNSPESSSEKWMLSASRVILHWTSCRCFLSQWTGYITRMKCWWLLEVSGPKKMWIGPEGQEDDNTEWRQWTASFDIPSTSIGLQDMHRGAGSWVRTFLYQCGVWISSQIMFLQVFWIDPENLQKHYLKGKS